MKNTLTHIPYCWDITFGNFFQEVFSVSFGSLFSIIQSALQYDKWWINASYSTQKHH